PHPLFGEARVADGLRLPGEIYTSLFEYQRTCKLGIKWLWELHQQETGGILGDEMGLGKTVQIVSFLAGMMYSGKMRGPTLVLCPATMLDQWASEFNRWWPPMRAVILHASGSALATSADSEPVHSPVTAKTGKRMNALAERLVQRVFDNGHVLLVTYEGLRRFQSVLLARKWFYTILDEGHKIRNPEAEITVVCKQLNTPHRIIVTGTPIQNNLTELWSLFDFVYPGRLGTLPVFESQFAIPINLGGYANASLLQVEIAYKCASVLRDLVKPYLLKRTKAAVAKDLPQKTEHVLLCRLTPIQRQAYEAFLRSKEMDSIIQGDKHILYGIDVVKKICNHPDLLEVRQASVRSICGSPERSGKMQVLSSLLDHWKTGKHRVLLFSQTRQMLDILERMVEHKGAHNPFARCLTYRRMDGGTPVQARAPLIYEFNHNSDILVFLLTTKVGGLGINLVGADRVVIFDPDWNPSTDVQARERAWRLGQTRDVAIYRLITAGTIEEKIYHRQIFKHYLSRKILNDPKQRRFFKVHDLRDLFTLSADAAATETGELFEGVEVAPPERRSAASTETGKQAAPQKQHRTAQSMSDAVNELAISGIGGISEYVPETQHEDTFNEAGEEDLLQQLFKMSGVKTIIKHDNIMDADDQEASLVEREGKQPTKACIHLPDTYGVCVAALFARQAATALREAGKKQGMCALSLPFSALHA
ncbi:SNF2 family N-terminal domain-containing protein, partial [Thamnocephalis sphaerospora]